MKFMVGQLQSQVHRTMNEHQAEMKCLIISFVRRIFCAIFTLNVGKGGYVKDKEFKS